MTDGISAIQAPRCRGLVFEGDALLMVRFNPPEDADHWEIPGGGSLPGESISDCVVREIREETGVFVELGEFRYFGHTINGRGIWPHLFFEASVVGGTAGQPQGLTADELPWFVECRFVHREELLEIPVWPGLGVWDRVWNDRDQGFPEAVYLGTFKTSDG